MTGGGGGAANTVRDGQSRRSGGQRTRSGMAARPAIETVRGAANTVRDGSTTSNRDGPGSSQHGPGNDRHLQSPLIRVLHRDDQRSGHQRPGGVHGYRMNAVTTCWNARRTRTVTRYAPPLRSRSHSATTRHRAQAVSERDRAQRAFYRWAEVNTDLSQLGTSPWRQFGEDLGHEGGRVGAAERRQRRSRRRYGRWTTRGRRRRRRGP